MLIYICEGGYKLPVSAVTYNVLLGKLRAAAPLWQALDCIAIYGNTEDKRLYSDALFYSNTWGSLNFRVLEALPKLSLSGETASNRPNLSLDKEAEVFSKIKKYVTYFRQVKKDKLLDYVVSLDSGLTKPQALYLVRRLEIQGAVSQIDNLDAFISHVKWSEICSY